MQFQVVAELLVFSVPAQDIVVLPGCDDTPLLITCSKNVASQTGPDHGAPRAQPVVFCVGG